MVWMRTAALSNFRKLWGRINETLEEGDYTVYIQNSENLNEKFNFLCMKFFRL